MAHFVLAPPLLSTSETPNFCSTTTGPEHRAGPFWASSGATLAGFQCKYPDFLGADFDLLGATSRSIGCKLFEVSKCKNQENWVQLSFFLWCTIEQRRRKRKLPPRKENLLENCSGFKEKLSRPVIDTQNLGRQRGTELRAAEIFSFSG